MFKLSWKTLRLLWQRCGRTLLITWPLILVITCLVFLALESMEILSACRAYVAGEGLWSKAQNDSVHYLIRYGRSRDAADYQKFLDSVVIPLDYRQARLELEKSAPDIEIIRRGFLKAGNHPDDLESVIKLYRRFQHLSFMSEAIKIWRQGEDYASELYETGKKLHNTIISNAPDPVEIRQLLDVSST